MTRSTYVIVTPVRDEVAYVEWAFDSVVHRADRGFRANGSERCFEHFANEPRLGIGGGTVCSQVSGELHVDSVEGPPFHVRGAVKIYRRGCWEAS